MSHWRQRAARHRRARHPSARPLAPLLTGAVALVSGCADSDPGDRFRVETLDGVPHSVAADAPEWSDATLELLWEAPPPDELLDGADWANPTQLAANHHGVAVLDPQLSRVHLFAPDGTRAGSVGRRGEGPGELTRPTQLAVLGDTIFVHDGRRPALQLFSRSGDHLGGFAPVEGMSFVLHHLEGVGVIRSSVVPAPGQTEQRWYVFGYDEETRPLAFPGDHPLQPQVQEGGTGCWRRSGAGARLLELDCTFPLVRVVGPDGEVLREHRIERAPELSAPDALAAMEERMRDALGRMGPAPAVPTAMVDEMVQREVERNRWSPVFRGAAGTVSGERLVLWEQLPDDLGGSDAVLHVLDGEGRYLVRQAMDGPLQAVAVTEDRIYVLASDPDTGLRSLRAYRMPLER